MFLITMHVSRQGGTYIRPSLYALYIRDWLEIFPREQFLFIKSEDYYSSRSEILQEVFEFLNIPPLPPDELADIEQAAVKNIRKDKGVARDPLDNETRQILDEFYGPYTGELVDILQTDKFSWK